MLLNGFKSNQTIILFALPIIAAVIWFSSFGQIQDLNSSYAWSFFEIENPYLDKIIALIFIIMSSILLNGVVNKNEIFERNTFLPSLTYVLLMSGWNELHSWNPYIVGNLFLILAYRRLLNIYNQLPCKSEIFDASFFVICAGIFVPAYLSALLGIWVTLMIFRPFSFIEYLMPFLAFGVISIYLFVWYLFDHSMVALFSFGNYTPLNLDFTYSEIASLSVLLISIYYSGFVMLRKANSSSIRFRKISTQLIAFISLLILSLIFQKVYKFGSINLSLLAVPLSILIPFCFFYSKRNLIINLLFYISICSIIVNIYSTY